MFHVSAVDVNLSALFLLFSDMAEPNSGGTNREPKIFVAIQLTTQNKKISNSVSNNDKRLF